MSSATRWEAVVEPVAVLSEDAAEYPPQLPGIRSMAFTDPLRLLDDAPHTEVLLASPVLAARVVDRLPRLRWVHSTWAGVEALCRPGLRSDFLLTRTEGVFGEQMREFVLTYLLLAERRVLPRLEAQQAGRWSPPDHGTLAGRVLGIMGTGGIAQQVSSAAGALGMRVIGCNRSGSPRPGFEEVLPVSHRVELAARSDHLVVLLPATPATVRLVDEAMIRSLPREAVLINAGRGSTIDLGAVVSALQEGLLSMAVLDVLEEEPLPPGDPLWDVPRLVITSHTAALSRPGDVAARFLENLDRLQRGEPARGVVDRARGY